jgi:DNA replication and repair protein RecF
VYVARLSLADFRSYAEVEVELAPGITVFVGPNGEGKSNLVEAIGYAAQQSSHRVATTAPLVRSGAERAIVRVQVVNDGRAALIELELVPGRANRARLNRAPVSRPRDVVGILRSVAFAPEDLARVKGDPGERRAYLDELATLRTPRIAAVRQDYDRVLKQRNTLLKTAFLARGRAQRRPAHTDDSDGATTTSPALATLDVWDDHLAKAGAALLLARLELVDALQPLVARAYEDLAPGSARASLTYKSSLGPEVELKPDVEELTAAMRAGIADARPAEIERGLTLVGPHRDELALALGDLPAKGYASHGESWSFALALRLAGYEILRADGSDPVLVLDDVFAELDAARRTRLAAAVAGAEQVLVTAAVPGDVPAELAGARFDVAGGTVRPDGARQ